MRRVAWRQRELRRHRRESLRQYLGTEAHGTCRFIYLGAKAKHGIACCRGHQFNAEFTQNAQRCMMDGFHLRWRKQFHGRVRVLYVRPWQLRQGAARSTSRTRSFALPGRRGSHSCSLTLLVSFRRAPCALQRARSYHRAPPRLARLPVSRRPWPCGWRRCGRGKASRCSRHNPKGLAGNGACLRRSP